MVKDKKEKRGLGRGLAALMAETPLDQVADGPDKAPDPAPRRSDQMVPVEQIYPNPDQPRRDFDAADLKTLTDSIRVKGVIQPLIVRADAADPSRFMIVAGERRWRAAQMAQLHELPVLVRDFSDSEVLEIAIIENIQRADLNPVEEALGYKQLMDRFGHTQEKMAEALGKSRPHIANMLRLLQLPDDVLDLIRHGKLSAGHARALITAADPSALARQVVDKGLSVRDAERLAKAEKPGAATPRSPRPAADKDADTRALEGDLSAQLKMKVAIDHKPGDASGAITIRYPDLEALDEICRVLGQIDR